MMKKKVLFVATEPTSGMIPFASTIINTLSQDSRFCVKCICVCRKREDYRDYIYPSVDAIFLSMPENPFKRLVYKFWPFEYISAIRKAERDFKPDYVHFLTGEFSLALYLLFANKEHHFLMVHDLYPHETVQRSRKDSLFEKWILFANRLNRNLIHNLTTCSWEQVNELKKLYPRKNVQFVPFPTLVTDRIKTGTKAVRELDGVNNYILFFGAVQLYKGIKVLLESFKTISHDADLKLVIAGREDIDIEDHEDIIRINRFIDDEEIAFLFTNSLFVVYPYLSATMSGVLSIAYFFKKRVLLSDIPYFKENASQYCTFFKCGDSNDLSLMLRQMLADKTAVECNAYEELYSKMTLADKYFAVY